DGLAPGKFQLLVDLKTTQPLLFTTLQKELTEYSDIVTEWKRVGADTVATTRAVTVLLTGERPRIQQVRDLPLRYFALDGKLSQMRSLKTIPVDLVPLISQSWQDEFT